MASLLAAGRATMHTAWQGYCDHLGRRPLATKVVTGVVGTLIGDGIAQATAHMAERRRAAARPGARRPRFQYDAARAARLCLYAAAIGSPVGHYWFAFLDKNVFPGRMGHPGTALLKVALDQAIMAPAGMALFYVAISLMEGKRLDQAADVLAAKFGPTMAANYLLWPAANFVNFRFVPPEQRILYVNAVYIGWVSFLSTMAAEGGGAPRRALAADAASDKTARLSPAGAGRPKAD
ncbi:hypothetical protein Rsub_05505 [Raphidocelis subcapitata]|uniref:Uncharacterized protein n=1 Tax=Raphidocelis subcapitata TaxID=307507 RepID=A0A2V0P373_9CHLO|nr:hypothetical protein Rsub_05505 [Raphidocelis subcapitata]|eukprot:GBF92303.1 hypothetical protein Rsub_05505 [Raphidocelis subcapitata]